MQKKRLHLTVRHALKQYKRYKRKYNRLAETGAAATGRLQFLRKRIERLKTFLQAALQKSKLATAAGALGLLLTSSSASAQTFEAPVSNPFGLANVGSFAAPALADLDGDGDLDMMVGEYLNGDFIYFQNTGSASAPAFAAPQTNPFGLSGIGYYGFSTPTFADLDGDGDLDMISGSFSYGGDIVYYQNTGTASAPAFGAPQTNPFGITIPYGTDYSDPSLADLDGDGDLDMLVGNDGYGTIFYYENTGTATAPAFAAPVGDPFGMTTFDNGITPVLVDFDGDGDLDLLTGEGSGNIYYLENTGTAAAPAFAAEIINAFTGLSDIGSYSNIEVKDIDGDGDLDIFSGNSLGDIHFFEQNSCTPPVAPTNTTPAGDLTVCEGETTTLTATGTGTLGWYSASTGGTYLGGGGTFVTPTLSAGVTYYVQDSSCAESPRTPVTITVNALPNVTISVAGGTSICEGETITLTASGAVDYVWAGGPSTADYTVTPLAVTTYSVTGTDANGCENGAFQMIMVNSLPDVTTTTSGATITANFAGATSYQWVTCPSYTPAPGASTNQSYTATANGDYAVIISNGSCSDTSHCETINSVGMNELNQTQLVSVYPNPSNGNITIQSSAAGRFMLTNEMGQLIQQFELNAGNNYSVNVENLGSGVYFITGMNKGEISRHKVVVTK